MVSEEFERFRSRRSPLPHVEMAGIYIHMNIMYVTVVIINDAVLTTAEFASY